MADDAAKAAHGSLAAGHATGPSPVPGGRTQHMNLATTTPVPGVVIHATPGGDVNSAPLMQSLASHPVPVAVMNQALASNPGLPGLFGVNMPRGIAPQPDVHTAPSTVGRRVPPVAAASRRRARAASTSTCRPSSGPAPGQRRVTAMDTRDQAEAVGSAFDPVTGLDFDGLTLDEEARILAGACRDLRGVPGRGRAGAGRAAPGDRTGAGGRGGRTRGRQDETGGPAGGGRSAPGPAGRVRPQGRGMQTRIRG